MRPCYSGATTDPPVVASLGPYRCLTCRCDFIDALSWPPEEQERLREIAAWRENVTAPLRPPAFDKIRALLPDRALKLLDEMRTVIGVRALGAKLLLGGADFLTPIHHALLERRTLGLDYFSFSKQEETTRFVDPYHLTYHRGGLYLIGYCHQRKDLRIFAVERIRRLKVTERPFAMPANFEPESFLEGSWGVMRGLQVKIRVDLLAHDRPLKRGAGLASVPVAAVAQGQAA